MYIKEREIYPVYISKIIQIVKKKNVLMIPNEEREGWHFLAVKILSALLRGII